jgi:hypothetical protein
LNNLINENRRWSSRENDRVLDEIANRHQNLRKTIQFNRKEETDNVCLHDRLMSEIKQKRVLKPIGKIFFFCLLYLFIFFFD